MQVIYVNGYDDLSRVEKVEHAWVGYSFIGGELSDIFSKVAHLNSELEEKGVNIEEMEINLSKGPYQGAIILVEEK